VFGCVGVSVYHGMVLSVRTYVLEYVHVYVPWFISYVLTCARTAAARYQQTEVDYYADQPNFVPFIVETGGRIIGSGLRFIDTLTGVLS
jgi:hypothetical protein